MNTDEKKFLKAVEIAMSDVLSRDDTKFQAILNSIYYFIFSKTGIVKYKTITLFDNSFNIKIPSFFHSNKFKIDNIVSEEFNYKKIISLAFALQNYKGSMEKLIKYRKDAVEMNQWHYKDEQKIKINNIFSQLIFEHKKLDYCKGIFISKYKTQYLVITIVAPAYYFKNRKSFLYRILDSVEFKQVLYKV